MKHVCVEDRTRTLEVLAELAAVQEQLAADLEATGLTEFVDRADWLTAHRSADERLAVERGWVRLCRRHRIPVAPRPARERVPQFRSLSVPKVYQTRTVIDPDRALQIALGATPVERNTAA